MALKREDKHALTKSVLLSGIRLGYHYLGHYIKWRSFFFHLRNSHDCRH